MQHKDFSTYLSDHTPLIQGSTLIWNIMTQANPGNSGFGLKQPETQDEYRDRLWQIANRLAEAVQKNPDVNKLMLQECPVSGDDYEYFKLCLGVAFKDRGLNWNLADNVGFVHGNGFGNLTLFDANKLSLNQEATNELRQTKNQLDSESNNEQTGRSLVHVFNDVKNPTIQEVSVNVHHKSRANHDPDIANHQKVFQAYQQKQDQKKVKVHMTMGGDFNTNPLKCDFENANQYGIKAPSDNTSFSWRDGTQNPTMVDGIYSNNSSAIKVASEYAIRNPYPGAPTYVGSVPTDASTNTAEKRLGIPTKSVLQAHLNKKLNLSDKNRIDVSYTSKPWSLVTADGKFDAQIMLQFASAELTTRAILELTKQGIGAYESDGRVFIDLKAQQKFLAFLMQEKRFDTPPPAPLPTTTTNTNTTNLSTTPAQQPLSVLQVEPESPPQPYTTQRSTKLFNAPENLQVIVTALAALKGSVKDYTSEWNVKKTADKVGYVELTDNKNTIQLHPNKITTTSTAPEAFIASMAAFRAIHQGQPLPKITAAPELFEKWKIAAQAAGYNPSEIAKMKFITPAQKQEASPPQTQPESRSNMSPT